MYAVFNIQNIFYILVILSDSRSFGGTEKSTFDPRIIGGQKTESGLLPYQVSIQFAASNFHYCAGSIISEYYVLSAAHCFSYFDAEDIQVWVGGRNLSNLDDGVLVDVEEIFLHEYDDFVSKENDIAILKLKDQLNFTDNIQKISLNKDDLPIGTECIVSGWGVTEDKRDQPYSDDLLHVNVFLLDREICEKNYGQLKKPVNITQNMICAGHPNGTKDACRGDSGGPLVCDNKLVGIVSFGAGCGLKNYPGVYTDIKFFFDWIANIIFSGANKTRFLYLSPILALLVMAKNIS